MYQGIGFNVPVESLNLEAVAKIAAQPITEIDRARGRQRWLEGLEAEYDRIMDVIAFHERRAGYYKEDVEAIDRKIAAAQAAVEGLKPLAPTKLSVRGRIAELEEQITEFRTHELKAAAAELDKHTRLLAVNRKLKEDFPHAELKAYLKEQRILAQAGL